MRQTSLLFIAAAMALLTMPLVYRLVTLEHPLAAEVSYTPDVSAARRFYDAVNLTIATGEDTALHDVLAPQVLEQTSEEGEMSLVHYLEYLHATSPTLRLVADPLLRSGESIVAWVSVVGETSHLPLGLEMTSTDAYWPQMEVLRVSGRLVVERQPSSALPTTIDRVATLSDMGERSGDFSLNLSRHEVAPTGIARFTAIRSSAVIEIAAGTGSVLVKNAPEGGVALFDPVTRDGFGAAPRVLGEGRTAVVPGMTIVAHPGSELSILNFGNDPIVLVALSVDERGATPESGKAGGTGSLAVKSQLLWHFAIDGTSATPMVEIGRAAMRPGSQLLADPDRVLAMVLNSESDALLMTGAESCAASEDVLPVGNLRLHCQSTSEGVHLINTSERLEWAWVVAVTIDGG